MKHESQDMKNALDRINRIAQRLQDEVDRFDVMLRRISEQSDWTKPTVNVIVKTVANHFGLDELSLRSKCRRANLVQARQVALYCARTLTKFSLEDIAGSLGYENGNSCIHGIKTAQNRIETEPAYKEAVAQVVEQCRTALAGMATSYKDLPLFKKGGAS